MNVKRRLEISHRVRCKREIEFTVAILPDRKTPEIFLSTATSWKGAANICGRGGCPPGERRLSDSAEEVPPRIRNLFAGEREVERGNSRTKGRKKKRGTIKGLEESRDARKTGNSWHAT